MTFRIHHKNGDAEDDQIISKVHNLSPDAIAAKIENHPIGAIVKIDHKGLSDAVKLLYIFALVPAMFMLLLVKDLTGPFGMFVYVAFMLMPLDFKKYKFHMICFNILMNIGIILASMK